MAIFTGTPGNDTFIITGVVTIDLPAGREYWLGSFAGLGGTNTIDLGGWGGDIAVLDIGTGEGRDADIAPDGMDGLLLRFSGIQNITLATRMAVFGDDGRNVIRDTSVSVWNANRFEGRGGNDEIWGGGGNDAIRGDNGDDLLFGEAGRDSMLGGAGNDTLHGGEGDDLLYGNDGHDSLYGGNGHDSLYGGNGNDLMQGGDGTDFMHGYFGDDIFYIDSATDVLRESAGQGIDQAFASVSYTLASGVEVELLATTARSAATAINLTGNAFAQRIVGNAGNNVLNGGLGNDTLIGSAGNDTFVFNTSLGAKNIDRINDFNVADDTIRLDDLVFAGLATKTLAASAFAANLTGTATDALDRIIYETDTGRLYFDADGNGGGARVLFATMASNLALTHADFFVF